MAQFCDVSSRAALAGVDWRRDLQPAGEQMQPTTGYPIVLGTGKPVSVNRFWAIPIVGFFVKLIILIPHFIMLYVLGIVVGICQLVIWIPVLFAGSYPRWAYQLVSGYVLWTTRVNAYLLSSLSSTTSSEASALLTMRFPAARARGSCRAGVAAPPAWYRNRRIPRRAPFPDRPASRAP